MLGRTIFQNTQPISKIFDVVYSSYKCYTSLTTCLIKWVYMQESDCGNTCVALYYIKLNVMHKSSVFVCLENDQMIGDLLSYC